MSTSSWRCRIIEEPANWSLHVESCGGFLPKNVMVLLDGAQAQDQPTVFKVQEMPGATADRVRLRIAFVPVRDRPKFDLIEVRWRDEEDRQRSYITSMSDCMERRF